MFYFIKTPKIVTWLFPRYIWNIPTKKKVIYLTFDDGPTPEVTEWTLNLLKKHQAKATFFCEGQYVEKHPEIIKKTLQAGHRVANHSYSHIIGWKTRKSIYINDIERTTALLIKQKAIKENDGMLFRPPYGKITPNQAKALQEKGYQIVMLDILTGDFDKNLNRENSLKKTLKYAKSGSIITFHDSKKAFENLQYLLPKALEYWQSKGYVFLALE